MRKLSTRFTTLALAVRGVQRLELGRGVDPVLDAPVADDLAVLDLDDALRVVAPRWCRA